MKTPYSDALAHRKNPNRVFADKIAALRADIEIVRAEAGRYGSECEFTQRIINCIEESIADYEWTAEEVYKSY